jgi:lysozyme family protein
MAHFEQAYAITRKAEGGYANKVGDTGGETWRGVSRHNNANWPGWHIVDAVKATHPANLNAALEARPDLEALVVALYKQNYWHCLSLDALQCQQTANQLFDISVNCGPGVAARFLQQALGFYQQPAPDVDVKAGRVGPLTIGTANKQSFQKIYEEINTLRRAFYERLIANKPADKQFHDSWMSRIHPFVPETNQNMA